MRELPPRLVDAAIAVVVVAATVLPILLASREWWIIGLGLLASLPVLWRRRAPLTIALIVGLAMTALVMWVKPVLPWGPLVAIFTIADLSPRWARLLAVPVVALAVGFSLMLPGEGAETYRMVGAAFIAAYAVGTSVRARRATAAELAERALRLEQERAVAIERERTSIARDMHDIVTHSVGRMVVQAEAGAVVLRSDLGRAESAFDAIADTGREALGELRGLLATLRTPEGDGREPQPGLHTLPDLLKRSGLDATLSTEGEPRPIAAGADVAVYRIVQEALTNVLRHAGTDQVGVRLRWSDQRLEVEIADAGKGGGASGGGYGLVGMRERAAAFGGTLQSGPGPDGGFVVKAAFPVG